MPHALWWVKPISEGHSKNVSKIKVIHIVWYLGCENCQFWHNKVSNAELGMEFYKTKYLRLKLVFPPILVVNWVWSLLSFFLNASITAKYIFTTLTCTTIIITFKPCALDAKFQHFILRYQKFHYFVIPQKEGIKGESRKDGGWKRGWP